MQSTILPVTPPKAAISKPSKLFCKQAILGYGYVKNRMRLPDKKNNQNIDAFFFLTLNLSFKSTEFFT
ncbi:hypothetical protein C0V77_16190 [Emticicia sp. TH156]|nr:hypothetical protein C0V77_16190 [Emticicia sp. TH156]